MNHFFYVYVGVTPRVEDTTIRLKNVSGKSYKILWQKKNEEQEADFVTWKICSSFYQEWKRRGIVAKRKENYATIDKTKIR